MEQFRPFDESLQSELSSGEVKEDDGDGEDGEGGDMSRGEYRQWGRSESSRSAVSGDGDAYNDKSIDRGRDTVAGRPTATETPARLKVDASPNVQKVKSTLFLCFYPICLSLSVQLT